MAVADGVVSGEREGGKGSEGTPVDDDGLVEKIPRRESFQENGVFPRREKDVASGVEDS